MSRVSFPRATGNPRELPELRAALVELARPSGSWFQAELDKLLMEVGQRPDSEVLAAARWHADNTVRWYRENLPAAQLIHVSPEMTEFVHAAAESAPPDTTLSLNDAPSPTGLVVFGAPIWGLDAGPVHPGGAIRVDAVMWSRVALPSRNGHWWEEVNPTPGIFGISVAMFRLVAPDHDDRLARALDVQAPLWLPLGRTDWPWGDRLDMPPTEHLAGGGAAQWDSMMEDRRLLVALWATINQRRLVETMDVPPDRYVRKRLDRAGHGGRNETVRIVHLRRSERVPIERSDSTGRQVSVRFPVRPFFRRQRYGPGNSLTRIVLIPPHWRGPENAPIVHHERVWEVDR